MKIFDRHRLYVASSWRNTFYEAILPQLREHHDCYDFRNPLSGGPIPPDGVSPTGFRWLDANPEFKIMHPNALVMYRDMLKHEISQRSFAADFGAMKWADTCVLVLPCGRSAHIEAGWMAGSGRKLVVYMPPVNQYCWDCGGEGKQGQYNHLVCTTCKGTGFLTPQWEFEPELMYLVGGDPGLICFTIEEVLARIRVGDEQSP